MQKGLCQSSDQLATHNLPRGISALDGAVRACWLCSFILHRPGIFKHVIPFVLLSLTPSNKAVRPPRTGCSRLYCPPASDKAADENRCGQHRHRVHLAAKSSHTLLPGVLQLQLWYQQWQNCCLVRVPEDGPRPSSSAAAQPVLLPTHHVASNMTDTCQK